MKLYADLPGRRTTQILSDVFMLCWVGVWVWAGHAVGDAIRTLRGPTESLTSAGNSLEENMSGAAVSVGGVPLVGDALSAPFTAVAGAGQRLAGVGASLGATVESVAHGTSIVVAVVPIVFVLVIWLFFRVRFVRRATAVARMLQMPGAIDLLALRALTRQPLRRLASVGPDPAGRFRTGDPEMVMRLADLELSSTGLMLRGPRSRGQAAVGGPAT